MKELYMKIGAVLTIVFAFYLVGAVALPDDMEDMLIQLVSLVLIFASSILIALESAKASYLEVLKSKHSYEANRVKNAIKGSFRVVFTQEAQELKDRKQKTIFEINKLKKEKVSL